MASQRVLVPKSARRKAAPIVAPRKAGDPYDYPVITVGRTAGGVGVFAAISLGKAGVAVAQDCMGRIDHDVAALADLFGIPAPKGLALIVAPLSGDQSGNGGAYHYGCEGTDLYCDCCATTPQLTSALFVAEAVEVFSAAQGKGWDCGSTNGEGLSRVLAELAYPGVLDGYETASAWLDGSRPNWIDRQQGTDTDDGSNGCAVLFLHFLAGPCSQPWQKIVQTGGNTLGELWRRLMGEASGWSHFAEMAQKQWPKGTPSGVTVDDPWTGTGGGGGGSGGGGGGGRSGSDVASLTVTTGGAGLPDGDYMLFPVPSDMARRLKRAGLTGAQWSALVQAVLMALLTALPTILGADGAKGERG